MFGHFVNLVLKGLKCRDLDYLKKFPRQYLNWRETEPLSLAFSHQAITCSHLTMETLEQMCERGSKLTIKTPKRQLWRLFGVFIINFEHISHLCSSVSIVNFK